MTPARRITSTHRLQLEPAFTFDDAAAQVSYLAALGISHLYLAPLLQAVPGSTHGYDVIDHCQISSALGGEQGFRRLVTAAHGAGLGLVVDIVPNHMAAPVPVSLNEPLWSMLRDGQSSPFATWFDVDWAAEDGRILWPVLGGSLDAALAAGELTLDRLGSDDVVRYHDHVLPLAPGTDARGMPLGSLLEQQHYRLASWREAADSLNYRRFFDITSLLGVCVEDPAVFDATHRLVLDLVRAGDVDGLRVDHPDGLADPQGYLSRLAEATGGAWTVVEKILEGPEQLPVSWACAGTTGYDSLLRVGGLFVDPAGAGPLATLSEEVLGERQDVGAMVGEAKLYVVRRVLPAEVSRLLRVVARALPGVDLDEARRAVEALLVGMDRYRVYVRPGEPRHGLEASDLAEALDRGLQVAGAVVDAQVRELVIDLAVGEAAGADPGAQAEFVVRFQQTCGPVMAKAVEDTVFYRYVRLVALNEVGGDPGHVGTTVDQFHWFAQTLQGQWPTSMTTLSTHDTKRSEDVRARLAVLAERPEAWAEWVRAARRLATRHRDSGLDALTEYLLWQTLVGAWPIDAERLGAYATKAVREAKLHTSWTDGDPDYEAAVRSFVAGIVADPQVASHVEAWLAATLVETRANVLGQKAIQLLMPGVPDIYQGTELVDLSLVDPDNRRPVDYRDRASRLARLDAGDPAVDLSDEKLLVTRTALRLRQSRPDVFVGPRAAYVPLASTSDHVIGFRRGDAGPDDVLILGTRLAGRLRDRGGWGDDVIALPSGTWRDVLSDTVLSGGDTPLRAVLPASGLPVAVWVRADQGRRG